MIAAIKRRDCMICSSILQWAIAIGVAAFCLVLSWLLWFDTNNARATENELQNESGVRADTFAPGDLLKTYRVVCVDRVVPGTVSVELVNLQSGAVYPMGSRATGAVAGCSQRTVPLRLPQDIAPGVYEYRATATYQVNPLRTSIFALPSMQFVVKGKP